MACGIWFLDQGSNWALLHWEHGVPATGPPGKSQVWAGKPNLPKAFSIDLDGLGSRKAPLIKGAGSVRWALHRPFQFPFMLVFEWARLWNSRVLDWKIVSLVYYLQKELGLLKCCRTLELMIVFLKLVGQQSYFLLLINHSSVKLK